MKPNNDKGAALVELAIIIPVLFLIAFGICEFGWAMYVKNTLGNAAREGARLASVTAKPISADDTRIIDCVKDRLTFSYAASDLIITVPTIPVATGDPVTVRVTLTYHTFTQFIPILDGSQFKGEATMRYEL